jgi:hypothetical protein
MSNILNKSIDIFQNLGLEDAATTFKDELSVQALDSVEFSQKVINTVGNRLLQNEEFVKPIKLDAESRVNTAWKECIGKHLSQLPAETIQNADPESLITLLVEKQASKASTDKQDLLKKNQEYELTLKSMEQQLAEKDRTWQAKLNAVEIRSEVVKAIKKFDVIGNPDEIVKSLISWATEGMGWNIVKGDATFPIRFLKKDNQAITVDGTHKEIPTQDLVKRYLDEVGGFLKKNSASGNSQNRTLETPQNNPNQQQLPNAAQRPLPAGMDAVLRDLQAQGVTIK